MIEPAPRAGPPLVAALVLLILAACDGGSGREPAPPEGEATLTIETTTGPVDIAVEVADTPTERQVGLMGRRELAPDAGMVFLHDEPVSSGFWMKDTLIPLSVAFWDDQDRIIGITDMEPCRTDPCPTYPAPDPWVGAVEVNQGFFREHGVRVGDRASLVYSVTHVSS
jgi:uncharacterized membrane protein (UPF0127 family)